MLVKVNLIIVWHIMENGNIAKAEGDVPAWAGKNE